MAGKEDVPKANGTKAEEKGKGKADESKNEKPDAEMKDGQTNGKDDKLLPPGREARRVLDTWVKG